MGIFRSLNISRALHRGACMRSPLGYYFLIYTLLPLLLHSKRSGTAGHVIRLFASLLYTAVQKCIGLDIQTLGNEYTRLKNSFAYITSSHYAFHLSCSQSFPQTHLLNLAHRVLTPRVLACLRGRRRIEMPNLHSPVVLVREPGEAVCVDQFPRCW